MKKTYVVSIGVVVLLITAVLSILFVHKSKPMSGAPPYVVEDLEPQEDFSLSWLQQWKRPLGPPRVGLQVGHWKNDELPEELARLKGNTGASGGGKSEAEVNLTIALETEKILEKKGIIVDILPATVPPEYWADAFVAIHADGSESALTSGYKVAPPRRDVTGNARKLSKHIELSYGEITRLTVDPNVTRNMTGYYAFAFWRYKHAVHPMTVPVIIETGFLTSSSDRTIIVDRPELSAQGISTGVIAYLQEIGILDPSNT